MSKDDLLRQLCPKSVHFDGYNLVGCKEVRGSPFFFEHSIELGDKYILSSPNYKNNASNSNNGNNGSRGNDSNCSDKYEKSLNALTSQIFADNLDKMKEAAISYYTTDRLPSEVGDSDKMTLSDMIGKKIIVALIDKNNKAIDVEKSYVKITKTDDEYILKVNIKDSEKEDYILVHLGCYSYCKSDICEKNTKKSTEDVQVKGSKPTPVVTIKKSYPGSSSYTEEK